MQYYDIVSGHGADIKLKGMHSLDFQDPAADCYSDPRLNEGTLTEARHDADLRLLFSYACMLAMRESTNAAASLAAYYMCRTGAHSEVGHILDVCLTNGWPEPRSPEQPGTPGAHVHAGHAPRQSAHKAHAALDSDTRVHACGATVAGEIPSGNACASACAAGDVRDAGASPEPAPEPQPEDQQRRQLRPRDEAFVDDMVAFLLSERWLGNCIPEFLDILMNSLEANELSAAEVKAVCEGLLRAATPAAVTAARGAAHTAAAAADVCTEALLRVLSEAGAAVQRPDGHAPTQHLPCSCPACDAGTWRGQSGHGVSPGAAAEELRGRFERSEKAIQVVPLLLMVTAQCKTASLQGACAGAGQNGSEKAEYANVDGAPRVVWLDEAQRARERALFEGTVQTLSGVLIVFVVLVFLLYLLMGGKLCLDVLHRIVSTLVAEEGLERQRIADSRSEL